MKALLAGIGTAAVLVVAAPATYFLADASAEAQSTPWVCSGPVDVDLVKVNLENVGDDAVILKRGCTGRIGRLEVDTWQVDGVKVRNQGTGPVTTDLVIESGYINCHAHREGAHQDGIQAMAGVRITFKGLKIRCGLSNAQFFVSSEAATGVVCDGCNLGPGASHTANVWGATNGVRNSILCKPETQRYFTKHGAAIDENNVRASAGDLSCS